MKTSACHKAPLLIETYCASPRGQLCRLQQSRHLLLLCPGVQERETSQHRIPGNLQTLWAQLIQRIFGRVVEGVVVAVIQIDEVHYGNAHFGKWKMIIINRTLAPVEVGLIAIMAGRS